MGNYLKLGGVVILITICLGIWWKVSSTISGLEQTIIAKDKVIKDTTDELNNTKLKLALEQGNVRELKDKLERLSYDITKLDNLHSEAVAQLEAWKSKPVETKYVESVKKIMVNKEYESGSCEEGKKLNLEISKLKYEEL